MRKLPKHIELSEEEIKQLNDIVEFYFQGYKFEVFICDSGYPLIRFIEPGSSYNGDYDFHYMELLSIICEESDLDQSAGLDIGYIHEQLFDTIEI